MGLRRAVLACVYVLVLTATVGLVAAAAPAKGTSPTIGFTAPSPAAGASVPGGSISFALSVNRTPEQLKTLTCALAGPTASTGACSAAVASGTGSSSGITYANLAPGAYTLTVSLVTLKLSDGGSASASRKFTVSQPAPQVDLSVTKTNGATTAVPGASTTYTIVVTNSGPSGAVGATVADTLPTELTNATWTALGTSGANGFPASGTGNISNTVNLPASASVTYNVTATLSALATGTLSNTATVTPAVGTNDTNTANNSATDTDTLSVPANSPPIAYDNQFVMGEDDAGAQIGYFLGNVLHNASDPDGDWLMVTRCENPGFDASHAGGTAELAITGTNITPENACAYTLSNVVQSATLTVRRDGNVLLIDPGNMFSALNDGESITVWTVYEVGDGVGGASSARMSIVINGENDN